MVYFSPCFLTLPRTTATTTATPPPPPPGLGHGATIGGLKKITDKCLYDISLALAECLTDEERTAGQVFPKVSRIREVRGRANPWPLVTTAASPHHHPTASPHHRATTLPPTAPPP